MKYLQKNCYIWCNTAWQYYDASFVEQWYLENASIRFPGVLLNQSILHHALWRLSLTLRG
jgi:hypothetical protein